MRARVRMRQEIGRFLTQQDRPLILAISRPDRRKNIDGLVTAYGEDKELQQIANLAVFAGVRKDIRDMDDNEREVLTRLLLLMDRYDLYGRFALPKKHDPDTDIPVLYRIAAASRGVFINPALVENFGITLLEAGASGLPAVSTDHGGPQDIIGVCDSGVLIDARDTGAIQSALKRVLVDREEWDRFSENGIAGVQRHFSWHAHAQRYFERVQELRGRLDELLSADWRTASGRKLTSGRRLLVSDIDHTLIDEEGGTDVEALHELADRLRRGDIAFALASGRNLRQVRDALAHNDLPHPDVLITSVGTEIYYGRDAVPDFGYSHYLAHGWKAESVHNALDDLDGLTLQEPEAQRDFKISYYVSEHDPGAVVERAREALRSAGVHASVVHSRDVYLDILAPRASKGKAIRYLCRKWGVRAGDVAVAGDSGNDEEMLTARFHGIVVGNHAEELKHLRGRKDIYFAEGHLARGVLQGLRHLSFDAGGGDSNGDADGA